VNAPAAILVCRLSALGDVVLALPVVDALRERWPAARLEMLSREPHGRVLRGARALDALHLWGGPGQPRPRAVDARAWDLLIDLSGSGRSRALLAGVNAARRLVVRKEPFRRFAFVKLRALGGARVSITPAVDRLFATVAVLGIERAGRVPRFDVPPPPPDGPVLLAPGAGRATKEWPVERFAEVAARLAQQGRRLVFVGSADERDLLERAAARVPPEMREVFAGPDPADLPAIVARCPLALTNDSGLLHVAEACGARVVALFGPTHPKLGFAPLGPGSVAIHGGISCSPCDIHGPEVCPKGHHRCLRDIPVERVLAELGAPVTAEVGA
jgi:heptosyltransferase-2